MPFAPGSRSHLGAALIMALAQAGCTTHGDAEATAQAVLEAEQAWWGGETTGDTIPMSPLTAPTFESVGPYGSMTRSEQLAAIQPAPTGDHEEIANRKIRTYGTTAVVTLEYRYIPAGQATQQFRVIDVWSLQRERWMMVFTTSVPLPAPTPAQ